jgi:hypothetical protein
METDEDSALAPDDWQHWENIPDGHPEDSRCSGEHASKNVKIRGGKSGALAIEICHKRARTPPPPSSHTPS